MQTIEQLEKIDLSNATTFFYREKDSKIKHLHHFIVDGKKYVFIARAENANMILNNENIKEYYKNYNFYYGEYENEKFLLRSDKPKI